MRLGLDAGTHHGRHEEGEAPDTCAQERLQENEVGQVGSPESLVDVTLVVNDSAAIVQRRWSLRRGPLPPRVPRALRSTSVLVADSGPPCGLSARRALGGGDRGRMAHGPSGSLCAPRVGVDVDVCGGAQPSLLALFGGDRAHRGSAIASRAAARLPCVAPRQIRACARRSTRRGIAVDTTRTPRIRELSPSVPRIAGRIPVPIAAHDVRAPTLSLRSSNMPSRIARLCKALRVLSVGFVIAAPATGRATRRCPGR